MSEVPPPSPGSFLPLRNGADFQRFIGEFTNYERMKDYRYAGDTMSLDRMRGLLRDLRDPQTGYPAIHVAGTKGKGTTSLILEALLQASGRSTGTYTSPHVEHVRERIRVNGRPVEDSDLCALTNSMLGLLESRQRDGPTRFPTFFELMTALAMLHFKLRRVDWGIFEVGLGGRLDATNVIHPRATAITSIGLEHTDKLGSTLAAIAREKAGIIKTGVPLCLGDLPAEAEAVVLAAAREQGAAVLRPERWVTRGPAAGPGHEGGRLEVRGFFPGSPPVSLPSGAVRGPALRSDLELALLLWRVALSLEGRSPGVDYFREALRLLELPARIEVVEGDPPSVIDGAHTPESMRALALTLEELAFPRPRGLVMALAADKALDPILLELRGLAELAVFTRADPARGREPAELAERYTALVGGPAAAIDDPVEAFEHAGRERRAVVVTGSFYLAGRLRPVARKKELRTLG